MNSTARLLLSTFLFTSLSLPVRAQNRPVPPLGRIGPGPTRVTVSKAKPHPALPSLEIPGALGVNIHFTDARAGELEMLEQGGFRVARMDFAWSGTEKVRGIYDFSAYNRLVKGLEDHHIQPLFILDYSNDLYDEGLSPHTDAGRGAFARWASAAAAHFKGHKVLWEMYNEPNGGFWKPKADVASYIKLAVATGRAIRESAPGECYIGPGVSGMDFDFLEACFQAGLLEMWDAVSVHPYRQNEPESVGDEYRRLRLMIERYKPKDKTIPILSGEWGYSSAWRDFNDERQGKYLPRQWMINLMNGVPVSIWYDWHDDGTDPKESEHHFGTTNNAYFAGRNPVYDPKPSYIAARTFSQFFGGFRFNKRVSVAAAPPTSADYVLLFSKGNEVKMAAWTTGTAHDITLPVSAGTFKIVNTLGVVQPQGMATTQGLKLHISDSPLYVEMVTPNAALSDVAQWQSLDLEYLFLAPVREHSNEAPFMRRDSSPVDLKETRAGFGQSSVLVVVNPLSMVAEPSPNETLLVHVENPLGVATTGQVTLNNGVAQAVNFAATQTEKNLSFPLPAPDATGEWNARVRFVGTEPDDVVEANYRFAPLRGFASLAAGNLAASLGVHADGNPEIASEQTLSVVPKAPETAPQAGPILKLTYRFSPGWKFANIQPQSETFSKIEGRPKRLGMWVYGDGSGNLLRMRWGDSTGQTFQPGGTALTWKGWQYVSFPIEPSSAHWGGANDGSIHGAIKVETLLLLDAAQQNGTQGEIYVNSLSWIY